MLASTRTVTALAAALFSLLLAAPSALAATPATVTVRVLGPAPAYEPLTPLTQVTTTTTPVTKDAGSCPGTSAAGALELATNGAWEGNWSQKYDDYEVVGIDGQAYPFKEGLPYWSFWENNKYEEEGICGVELEAGDQLLFFPQCYSATECPSTSSTLGIVAPASAEVGAVTDVTVERYNAKGEPSPLASSTVSGGGTSGTTDAQGEAELKFPGDGSYTLRATGAAEEEPKAVPGEALICVHAGDDGMCGTPTSAGTPPSAPPSSTVTGPTTAGPEILAAVKGIREGRVFPRKQAPRVLSGTVSTQSSVTSISLRLRRRYRGRCWAYNGARDRLLPAGCGKGSFFHIASGGDAFSYLLPARLPRGRYVLEIQATDSTGERNALVRGSSLVVFYVK
jgi:hypothetical protein